MLVSGPRGPGTAPARVRVLVTGHHVGLPRVVGFDGARHPGQLDDPRRRLGRPHSVEVPRRLGRSDVGVPPLRRGRLDRGQRQIDHLGEEVGSVARQPLLADRLLAQLRQAAHHAGLVGVDVLHRRRLLHPLERRGSRDRGEVASDLDVVDEHAVVDLVAADVVLPAVGVDGGERERPPPRRVLAPGSGSRPLRVDALVEADVGAAVAVQVELDHRPTSAHDAHVERAADRQLDVARSDRDTVGHRRDAHRDHRALLVGLAEREPERVAVATDVGVHRPDRPRLPRGTGDEHGKDVVGIAVERHRLRFGDRLIGVRRPARHGHAVRRLVAVRRGRSDVHLGERDERPS